MNSERATFLRAKMIGLTFLALFLAAPSFAAQEPVTWSHLKTLYGGEAALAADQSRVMHLANVNADRARAALWTVYDYDGTRFRDVTLFGWHGMVSMDGETDSGESITYVVGKNGAVLAVSRGDWVQIMNPSGIIQTIVRRVYTAMCAAVSGAAYIQCAKLFPNIPAVGLCAVGAIVLDVICEELPDLFEQVLDPPEPNGSIPGGGGGGGSHGVSVSVIETLPCAYCGDAR